MKRIALGIEYDGSRYCGWQRQAHSPSVQETLETALAGIADHPVTVTCAGRTDTGVHAVGQVVHFDLQAERPHRAWLLGGNTRLPDDVSIVWARVVKEDFHARFSAVSRCYRYVILNRSTPRALLARRVTWVYHALDVEPMAEAARFLLGEHDFSSFRAAGCQAKSPVRTVESVAVTRSGDFVYLDIRANAFLHHMVRNMAGVLIDIGKGDRPVDWVPELLEKRDRKVGGVTAPPQGLYFAGVTYPRQHGIDVTPPAVVYG
ncbi:MAG TPA: tRNA pseudouridine(38-40) synthase TruA [Rhodobacteraceae bacterium]|nr:tRNA pseudouridine(38-40) synthase TruA [Paracoccaceae bacterium]